MRKQFDMKNRIIKTKEEYEIACERVYEIIHSSENPIEPNSIKGEELELLSLLIENYEKENFSIEAPSPIEAIKFRMEQMNLKQADIAPLFGGKTRVSEVLNGKRPLTLKMIALLHKYLEIPFESLITENYKYNLSNLGKEQLMKIPSIKKLQSGKNIAIA
jgi:HTH-type transcriptional regulator / antitoxin HigA